MQVGAPRSSPDLDAESVWAEFHDRLLGFIARRVDSRETAEDILQEVMLRIHRNSGALKNSGAVGSWIHSIARNAIADHHRSARVRLERAAGSAVDLERQLGAVDEADEDFGARQELAACIEPLLGRLPDRYQEALRLVEIEGATQGQTAEMLGLSVSGAKSRVQRGRRMLKDVLTDCCEVEIDRRGEPIDFSPRGGPRPC